MSPFFMEACKAAWTLRAKRGINGLVQVTLKGKPNTAMLAKRGFLKLTDVDVTSRPALATASSL